MNLTSTLSHGNNALPFTAQLNAPQKEINEKEKKADFFAGLTKTILAGAIDASRSASSWYLGGVFTWLTKSDPKVYEAHKVALKQLGFGETIPDTIDSYIQQAFEEIIKNDEIKKYLDANPDRVKELKITVQNLLCTALTNFAHAIHAKKQGANAQMDNKHSHETGNNKDLKMMDILTHLAEVVESHITGTSNRKILPFMDAIAKIEASGKTDYQKTKILTDLFTPIVNDIFHAAFPKGLSGVGLGFIQGYIVDGTTNFILGSLPILAAENYLKFFEPIAVSKQRKETLEKSPDGKLIIETVDIAAAHVYEQLPLLKKLGGFGRHIAESLILKLFTNLANHDAKNPLQSAVANLQGIFTQFYLTNEAKLKAAYQKYLDKQAEYVKLKAVPSMREAAQKRAQEEHLRKLETELQDLEKQRNALFEPLVKSLWEASKLQQDPLLGKLGETALKELPKVFCSGLDKAFIKCPGLLNWMAPKDNNIKLREEIKKSGVDASYIAIADGLAKLITAPLPKIMSGDKEKIANLILSALPDQKDLPLSASFVMHLKTIIMNKLESVAKNPEDESSLWQFIQSNVEGLALDIVKSVGSNPKQLAILKAITTLSGEGKTQDVLDAVEKLKADFREEVEAFQKGINIKDFEAAYEVLTDARDAVVDAEMALKIQSSDKAKTTLEEKKKALAAQEEIYNAKFGALTDRILARSGLSSLFASEGRFNIGGLESILRGKMSGISAKIYEQIVWGDKLEKVEEAAPAVEIPLPPAKDVMSILAHLARILSTHFNGLPQRIAAIEISKRTPEEKKKELVALFKPLVDDLYAKPEAAAFLMPLIDTLTAGQGPLQSMIKIAANAMGSQLKDMLPSILATTYPLLIGSCSGLETRKDFLNSTGEGQIILHAVKEGGQQLLSPLINGLLQSASGQQKDFSKDPIVQGMSGFGTYLAETLLTKLILNLSSDNPTHPLQGFLDKLKGLFGDFYLKDNNEIKLKEIYQQYLQHKKERDECDPNDHENIARLEKLLAEDQSKKVLLFAPFVEKVWGIAALDNEPPISLFPNVAKKAIPSVLSLLDKLMIAQPGLLNWMDPKSSNEKMRAELEKTENGKICAPAAIAVSYVAAAPVIDLLKKEKEAIAESAVKEIAENLKLDEKLQKCLKEVIASQLENLTGKDSIENHPLWQFIRANVEGVLMTAFSTANDNAIKRVQLAQALLNMAGGGKPEDALNPLLTLAKDLVDKIVDFHEVNGVLANDSYDKLEKARSTLPRNPTDAEKQAFNKLEDEYYAHFKPLVKDLLKTTGLDKWLKKDEGKLSVFGLNKVIRKQLCKLCSMGHDLLIHPEKAKSGVHFTLSKALYDQKHAASIARKDKKSRLNALGVALNGADEARQKEILEAAGAEEAAKVLEQNEELLAGFIESELKRYLANYGKDIAGELNREVLENRVGDPLLIKIIGDTIQNLTTSNAKGINGLFQYLHSILTPALSKAMTNIIQSTPRETKSAKGDHTLQMTPLNIFGRIFGTMDKEVTKFSTDKAFVELREKLFKNEEEISKKNEAIHNASKQSNPQPSVDQLNSELEKLKEDAGKLHQQMAVFFQPMTAKLLAMTSGNATDVSNPKHPLHDAAILPAKTRNTIWNSLLVTVLGQVLSSHYHRMNPDTEALEKKLSATTKNNKWVEFCRYMAIIVRDATPESLTKDPQLLAKNLAETIQNTLENAPADAPDYIRKLAASTKNHKEPIQKIIAGFIKGIGSSKLHVFVHQLWPALQKFSYPVMLKLLTKLAEKLKECDTQPNRTKLTIDLLKLISRHANTANAAAEVNGFSHPHEMPAQAMMQHFQNVGQLHPVIDKVLKAHKNPKLSEQQRKDVEAAARKEYATEFVKDLFKMIGFSKEDLPLEDAEKGLAFSLLENELGPLLFDLSFSSIAPGEIMKPIGEDLMNSIEINLLEAYQKYSQDLKNKAVRENAIADILPELEALLPGRKKSSKPASAPTIKVTTPTTHLSDEAQAKIDEEMGLLIKGFIQQRCPDDPIVREPLFMKPLLEASAKDLGAAVRLHWCINGSIKGTADWLLTLLMTNLFPGSNYDEKADKLVTKERNPEYHIPKADPAGSSQQSDRARTLSKKVLSQIIIEGIEYWFNGVIDSISDAFNLGLHDLYRYIDKRTKTTRHSQNISKAIKSIVWYAAWGLFYTILTATGIGLPLFLLTKYVIIPWRMRVNRDHAHKDMLRADNRDLILHMADRGMGRKFRAATPDWIEQIKPNVQQFLTPKGAT